MIAMIKGYDVKPSDMGARALFILPHDGTCYFVMHAGHPPDGAERPRLMRITEIAKDPYLQLTED